MVTLDFTDTRTK